MQQFKRDKKQNSTKLHLDKYYTPIELAKYCIDKTYKVIGKENISEVIEPSAGNGSFSNHIKDCIAYDIEPESDGIVKQDFLQLEIPYKQGRLIIGNPPFGRCLNLAQKFFKKSVQIADYVAFILPISQLDNSQSFYEFDLIHSEDLGKQIYSDREVHCCFNIYKRPKDKLNSKPNYKLKDITVYEKKRTGNDTFPNNYDFAICGWGASIGKEINYKGQYANEKYIVIHNEKYKTQIIDLLKKVNWIEEFKMTATPNLCQWQVYKYIKEQIPEIE